MDQRTMLTRILSVLSLCLLSTTFSCSRESKPSSKRATNNESAFNSRKTTQSDLETKILHGTVSCITDGDTIEVLDDQRGFHKIRLKGIDAPEKRQAFGNLSRENLAVMVAGKPVTVEWQKSDRDGRIIGKILAAGNDICLQQIKAGFAWHFKRFANEQSEPDRQSYAQAEQDARSQKLGLWQEPSQIEPWNFRDHLGQEIQ